MRSALKNASQCIFGLCAGAALLSKKQPLAKRVALAGFVVLAIGLGAALSKYFRIDAKSGWCGGVARGQVPWRNCCWPTLLLEPGSPLP
jgi:hypothetical protein